MAREKVAVRNINHPGRTTLLDKAAYEDMKKAMLKVIPRRSPGLTPDDIHREVLPLLSRETFPGGARAGWWAKCVQLDLEARGLIVRAPTRPLRLTRA